MVLNDLSFLSKKRCFTGIHRQICLHLECEHFWKIYESATITLTILAKIIFLLISLITTVFIFQEKLGVKYSYYQNSTGELLEPGASSLFVAVLVITIFSDFKQTEYSI